MLEGLWQWLSKMPMQSASNVPLQELTGISRNPQPFLPPGIGGPMNQMQMLGQIMQGMGKQQDQQQPQMAPPPNIQPLGQPQMIDPSMMPGLFAYPQRPRRRGLLG